MKEPCPFCETDLEILQAHLDRVGSLEGLPPKTYDLDGGTLYLRRGKVAEVWATLTGAEGVGITRGTIVVTGGRS